MQLCKDVCVCLLISLITVRSKCSRIEKKIQMYGNIL